MYPFAHTEIATITAPPSNKSDTFGFKLADDELYKRVYVKDIDKNSCASKIFSTAKATNNKLKGAYITHINGDRVFNVEQATEKLLELYDKHQSQDHGGVPDNKLKFNFKFAPERKLTGKKTQASDL